MDEHPEPTPQESSSYVPPVVDESRDFNFGIQDVILAILTFPLLIWTLQYAFSGSEKLVATPAARLKLYLVLLVLEAIIAVVVWMVFFR